MSAARHPVPSAAAGGSAAHASLVDAAVPVRPVRHEWVMRRNCSLTPRQAMLVYLLLSVATLGIALVFTLRGAWMVMAFALVESGAIGVAMLYYARHALDQERILLGDGWLRVEWTDGARRVDVSLDPHYTRVTLADLGMRTLIQLEARGQRIEVGRFLTPHARHEVARQLRRALRPGSLLG
ncbi:DUF2244 domain-containing protein [Massilia niastensis]|uniref:DUF2244 domain-containing protein n=1 Tax=Massilia niastensis TaxID=544911 RepID=UPI00035CDF4C|nr:DUF2244 domain-containing protein [Massilia niastensis]